MAHATAQFLWPLGGAKRSNIIKSQLQSQVQRFLNQTLCVFSQMKDIKHITKDFYSVPWVMPQGLGLGGVGGPIFFYFLNIVMLHIKLKGINSRHEYTEKFYPRIKLVTLGWGQRIKYHNISSRAWGFAMARHRMCSSFSCINVSQVPSQKLKPSAKPKVFNFSRGTCQALMY